MYERFRSPVPSQSWDLEIKMSSLANMADTARYVVLEGKVPQGTALRQRMTL